jgi:hypothetical protein
METQQYEIELQKLKIERSKAKWTAISIFVPLLAALVTLVYGFRSTEKQAEMNFQLEAAKAVMQASSASDALDRVTFLKAIFPQVFGNIDVNKVNRTDFSADYYKLEFLKLVANRGLTAAQTADLWRKLFPLDTWASNTIEAPAPKN